MLRCYRTSILHGCHNDIRNTYILSHRSNFKITFYKKPGACLASKIVKALVYTCFAMRKTREIFETVEKISLVLYTPILNIVGKRSNRTQNPLATFPTISFFFIRLSSGIIIEPSRQFYPKSSSSIYNVYPSHSWRCPLTRYCIDVFLHMSFTAHYSLPFSTVSKDLFLFYTSLLPSYRNITFILRIIIISSFISSSRNQFSFVFPQQAKKDFLIVSHRV